jgi:chemotaxis protein CheX
MTEEQIKVFIDGAVRYFERVSGQPVTVEAPYLETAGPALLTMTGIIGISGRHRGAVYFTADLDLLNAMLETMGEPDRRDDHLADLVGEVANTLAGNARRVFGSEFLISVPKVLRDPAQELAFPRDLKIVAIPLLWLGMRAFLFVCLDRSEA